jgi:glycosyltransferase involved in cell wall biosynthesis
VQTAGEDAGHVMKQPSFSILLPTKNRSDILGGAIESALNQSFPDLELIISDNDDSATATRAVVDNYKDSRIRYHRTSGKLPMHENWETAFGLATGQFVLVLEDKQRLVRNALEILNHYIQRQSSVPISYDIQFARHSTIPDPPLFPSATVWRSTAAIDLLCRFDQTFFAILPKGLDSCAPRPLMQDIKGKSPTGLLFSYISPDYASGFLLLSAVPEFLHINAPLVYIPNNWMWRGKYSNGQASYRKTEAYKQFLASLPVQREDIVRNVPIKSEFLWINSVLYDLLTLYRRPEHVPNIQWVKYYGFCVVLILMGKKLGGDLRDEIRLLKVSLRERSLGFKCRVGMDIVRRGTGLVCQAVRRIVRS